MALGKSQTIVPSTYLGMGAGKICCSLVADLALSIPTDGKRRWWRSLTALSPGLRGGGLESQFGRGPRHLGQESDGLVLLVPGVQVGRVFLGYPAGGIDSRIAGKSDTACLRFSIVVRTEDERWKMKRGNLIAYHLLESSTGAYIEWLVNEPMQLLIKNRI